MISADRRGRSLVLATLAPFMALFAPLFVAPSPSLAADALLGGRPFSAPDTVMPMPDDWLARPLTRAQGADLALALDQQLHPAIVPLIQRWAGSAGVKVALLEGTCGIASGALADKTADITGMCCPPGDLDRLPGVRFHTLGIAAVALIVNPANHLQDVSLKEARRLFGGEMTNWGEMPVSGFSPGPGARVETVTRLHCQARPGDWRLLLADANQFSATSTEVPTIVDMIAEVARTRTAIGYETLWHLANQVAAGTVRPLKLGGVAPGDFQALAEGRYPIYRVFNITTWEGPHARSSASALAIWLVAHADEIPPSYGIVPAAELRRHGWVFRGDEIVGEPR